VGPFGPTGDTGATGPGGGNQGPVGATGPNGFSHVYYTQGGAAVPTTLATGQAGGSFRVLADAQVYSPSALTLHCTLTLDGAAPPLDETTVDVDSGFSQVVLEGAGTAGGAGTITFDCPGKSGLITVNGINIQAIKGVP
jgi:hypothetical protein